MTAVDSVLDGVGGLRIQILGDRVARVQIDPAERFGDSALNRYGFVRSPATAGPPSGGQVEGADQVLSTTAMTVSWGQEGALLTVSTGEGKRLLTLGECQFRSAGARAVFEASRDENWVGFGDQTRDRLYHRGTMADCHVRNVRSYIPVPFFMSTAGYGILVNTTHRIVFDMCASSEGCFEWRDGRGTIDFYVFAAPSFRDILDLYTDLTGRPKLPPEWSFGLWYICRTQANDCEVVNDAVNFRREEIPCDVIGLEPGWMATNYDGSLGKNWHPERFPIPSYARTGPHNFFNAVQRMGYHMELWLCCDYDLSLEAERRLGNATPAYDAGENAGFFQHDAEHDAHFSQPRYQDTVTRRDEPWFEHLRKFVDQGVDFFKQDGAYQVLDHPDRGWGNGMGDEEMHNLYPLLYARQMVEGFEAHTGRRGVSFTPCGWAGFQAWAGTWTGDTGGGEKTLGAMLNTAMVGHSWSTNDMEVTQVEALHFGYLLPWAQINSWNYFRMPWVQGARLLEAHRFYSRLRARLIPYIYSWAWQATRTGFPLIAPLTLEFQDDPECREIMAQFLLGRDLMVCALNQDVYLPRGRWKDFWTGEVLHGPGPKRIRWPETRGGGLYVREGAVIPFGPLMQYRSEKPMDDMELYVFPGEAESTFSLYEDDGVSLACRDGGYALTNVAVQPGPDGVRIEIAQPRGAYDGVCSARTWTVRLAVDAAPATVSVDGHVLPLERWVVDGDRGELVVSGLPAACVLEVR